VENCKDLKLDMHESKESKVIVYHDETKTAGINNLRGHALLFVPVRTKIEYTGGLFELQTRQIEPWANLFKDIEKIRKNFQTSHKFHFSKISGGKWSERNEAEKQLVQIGVKYLKQQRSFCKLGMIFYQNPQPNHIAGYGGDTKKEQRLRFGETVLRMLLKGTVHHLYKNSHRVKILTIITDGQPHYRRLNEFRILSRLMEEVRDYVEIYENAELVHLPSDHKEYNRESEEYIHANMLQLTDMLLGSSIHACLKNVRVINTNPKIGDNVKNKKGIVAYPVKEMLDKRKRGRSFQNSSHYGAFSITMAFINNNEWGFENIIAKDIPILNKTQLSLF